MANRIGDTLQTTLRVYAHEFDARRRSEQRRAAPEERYGDGQLSTQGRGDDNRMATYEAQRMFHLGRPDVLPVGDLGIRRAVMIRYKLRKLPEPERLEKIAKPWIPHRTLACRFLRRLLDATPV